MLSILALLILIRPALSQICCTPDQIEFDLHQHVLQTVQDDQPYGGYFVSHAVFDAAQMVYSLTYTDKPEGHAVTRATVDYSGDTPIEYVELEDGSCIAGQAPVVMSSCVVEGSTLVGGDSFTIAGHVEAQLYHFPSEVTPLERFAAVDRVDADTCEPIYDSNAYIGPDYLGRAIGRLGANTYMNYKVGIDDPSDLDIPVDCDVYTAKQMRDFHDMNKMPL